MLRDSPGEDKYNNKQIIFYSQKEAFEDCLAQRSTHEVQQNIMKNKYNKAQLSWSKAMLDLLYNFSDRSERSLFLSNPELDFLAYLVLRSRNQPDQVITFKRCEVVDEVYDSKISGKNLAQVFMTFNVKRKGNLYEFKYPNIFLFNRLKKGMNDRNYLHVPYKAIPIDTWLKIRKHDNKFARRLALYILYISNDFVVGIEKLRYRIGMYERLTKYKGRDLSLIRENLDYLTEVGFIKEFVFTGEKFLIRYRGVKSFEQLNGQVYNPKLNHKQEVLKEANNATEVNRALGSGLKEGMVKEPTAKNLKPEFDFEFDLPNDNYLDMGDLLMDEP